MSSIKLEVGKSYVMHFGGYTEPLELGSEGDCFFLTDGDCRWNADGSVIESGDHPGEQEARDFRIVGEVPAPCALKAAVDVMEEAAQAEQKADAAGAGSKFDAGKPPIGLIPAAAIIAEAEVLAFGAQKYDAHNWRKGMRWSRLGDAAARHLFAWLDGEDLDPETGLHHLAHLRADAGFLLEYAKTGAGTDDRFKA